MRDEYSPAWGPLESMQGTINLILRVAAVILVLITGYYIYGVVFKNNELFRGMTATGQVLSAADFQRQLANMELLTKILLFTSIFGIVSAIARYYAVPETGVVLVVIGFAMFFGMPFLIDNMGGPDGGLKPALQKLGDPRLYLKSRYTLTGALFLAAGAVYLLAHALTFVTGLTKRRPRANAEAAKTAQQVRKQQDTFLGPCWLLPFCRDTEKKLCPVRKSRSPCWRTGRGCYCDQGIIMQLSGGAQYGGAAGYLSRSAPAAVARPKTRAEKREQCMQCPVYLHHQAQKYKLLAPVSLLGLVAFFGINWSQLTNNWYPGAIGALGRAAGGFNFGPSSNGVPGWANDMAHNPTMMWMLLAVIVVLALSYILHGVEWVLYRLGI